MCKINVIHKLNICVVTVGNFSFAICLAEYIFTEFRDYVVEDVMSYFTKYLRLAFVCFIVWDCMYSVLLACAAYNYVKDRDQ